MQCHVIILDTTGATYTFYEMEKQKETIKERNKNTKYKSKNEKKKILVYIWYHALYLQISWGEKKNTGSWGGGKPNATYT